MKIVATGVCTNQVILSCEEKFNFPAYAINNYATNNCTGNPYKRQYYNSNTCGTAGPDSFKFGCNATHSILPNYPNSNCSGTPKIVATAFVCAATPPESNMASCYPNGFGGVAPIASPKTSVSPTPSPKLSAAPSSSPKLSVAPSSSPKSSITALKSPKISVSSSNAPKTSNVSPSLSIASSNIINCIGVLLIVGMILIH